MLSQLPQYHWLDKYQLILGSQSPRRAELLRGLGLDFRQQAMPDLDESYPLSLAPSEVAPYLSKKKAEAYRPNLEPNEILITSDTTVILEEEILDKTSEPEQALENLRRLSGRSHMVITGLSISTQQGIWTQSDRAIVHVAPLSEDELRYYLEHYAPYDKAGSYGIQEWLGYRAVERIEGSYYTIMGLPTHLVTEGLLHFRPH